MRIVFVLAEADLSGGVRTVATYARLLSRRGHAVSIVSTPPAVPSPKARLKTLLLEGLWPRSPRPAQSHVDDAGVDHRVLDRHRAVTDRDVPDADVVVATWWRTAEWVAALSSAKGTKVHFIQGDERDIPGQPRERVAATWRLPMKRIVCSRWLQTLAADHHGDGDTRCVPNGVDVQFFSSPARSKQARPTVGLIYSEAWIKGCDVALDAFELACTRVKHLRLVAFGSRPLPRSARLPSAAEFVLRPPQEMIPKLYASADAWLWPSRREGFGLPILEAMACRTPVIAAPAGAASELLSHGGGVLLPEADPAAMAAAIGHLLSLSDSAWGELSEQARATAEAHPWEASVVLFEAALEGARGQENR